MALKKKKSTENEERVKKILFIRFSQIIATILMVFGIVVLIVILYLKYYS